MSTYGIYQDGEILAEFVAPLTVKSNQPVFSTDALTLKRSNFRRSGQRWEITSNLIPLTHTANQLFAFFVKHGHSERFQILMPQNVGSDHQRTALSDRGLCTGLVGSDTVSITNQTGLIPAGTFIRFSNHSKIYMLTEDFDRGSQMRIYPRLRMSVSNTSFKCNDDVLMEALFDTDTVIGMVFVDGILMDNGVVKIIEAL